MDNRTSPQRRTVLVLTSSFPRYQGDYNGNFIFNLYRVLQERYDSRISLIILSPSPNNKNRDYKEVTIKNTKIVRFKYFLSRYQQLYGDTGMIANIKSNILSVIQLPLYVFSQIFYSIKLCKTHKINIIHAHWIVPQGISAVICKKLFKIPIVVSIHGTDIRLGYSSGIIKTIEKVILSNSDIILANSKYTKNMVSEIMGHSFEKIKVLPMGVDLKREIQNSNDTQQKNLIFCKEKSKKIILYVGRLIPEKGIYNLIASIEELSKYRKDIKLCIVGDGPEKKHIERIILKKHLYPYVELLGYVDNLEVWKYYHRAHLVVLPSIKRNRNIEGFGLSIAEAMACKKPVIITDVCGISYLLTQYKTGIIVKSGNVSELTKAINLLLEDMKLSKKLGILGWKLVEKKLRKTIIAKKHLDIYYWLGEDNDY